MPDETALTVPQAPGAVQEWAGADWGEFDLPNGVAPILPEIRIVQKATPTMGPESGKHGGDFWLSDTGEFVRELVGTVILSVETRALFDEDEQGAPVCSSLDGRVPRAGGSVWAKGTIRFKDMKESQVVPMSHAPAVCAVCPFNQWIERKKPPCRASYLALFELAETGGLYRIRFGGTGIGPFRNWLGRLAGSGARRGGGSKPRPPASQQIRIYTTFVENKDLNTTWYEPRIDVVGDTPVEEAESYRDLIAQVRPSFARTLEETATDMAEETDRGEPASDGWGGTRPSQRQSDPEPDEDEDYSEPEPPPPAKGRPVAPQQPGLGGAVDPDDLPFE